MKINQEQQNSMPAKPKKITQSEIKARIAEKFGEKAQIKVSKPEDKVDIKNKGVSHSGEEGFGDVDKNDPTSDVTHEKLKSLLKTGAFSFNDRERKVLGQILK